jgi:CRISPR-associated endoribonuclease Cas6
MRVRLVFQVVNRGGLLPFHHQRLLSEFIKTTIRSSRQPFSGSAFYNFSGLKGQSRVTREGLFYDSAKVTFVLSAGDPGFIDNFIQALFGYEQIFLGTLLLKPFQVIKEEVYFQNESTKFVCLSPLIVISEGLPPGDLKKFISPTDSTFANLLYDSTLSRMERSGFFSPEEMVGFSQFSFEPELEYLQKSRTMDKKFSRIYQSSRRGNDLEVRGYTFPFVLKAPSAVQDFIFHSGLGEETEEGFGMVDLAERSHQTRLIPYYDGNLELPAKQSWN